MVKLPSLPLVSKTARRSGIAGVKQTVAAALRPKAHIRQENSDQILRAAEQVFAENGFTGARMSEIARVSGLPQPNIHYYFGTKEALYRTLLEDVDTRWRQELDEWIVPGRMPAEALRGYVTSKMAHSRARPYASKVFANELLHGAPYLKRYLKKTLRSHVERKAEIVRGWIADGLMDPIDPTHLFFNIWAMTQTYADFDTQVCAVLGIAAMDDKAYRTATETVIALVLKGCGITPAERGGAARSRPRPGRTIEPSES